MDISLCCYYLGSLYQNKWRPQKCFENFLFERLLHIITFLLFCLFLDLSSGFAKWSAEVQKDLFLPERCSYLLPWFVWFSHVLVQFLSRSWQIELDYNLQWFLIKWSNAFEFYDLSSGNLLLFLILFREFWSLFGISQR